MKDKDPTAAPPIQSFASEASRKALTRLRGTGAPVNIVHDEIIADAAKDPIVERAKQIVADAGGAPFGAEAEVMSGAIEQAIEEAGHPQESPSAVFLKMIWNPKQPGMFASNVEWSIGTHVTITADAKSLFDAGLDEAFATGDRAVIRGAVYVPADDTHYLICVPAKDETAEPLLVSFDQVSV